MSHHPVRFVLPADLLLPAACCFLGCMSAALAVAPFDPPLRDQWSRGDTRVLREWLLLGPLPGTLQSDELSGQGSQPDESVSQGGEAASRGGEAAARGSKAAVHGGAAAPGGGKATVPGGEAAAHPAAGDAGGPGRWIPEPWGQDLLELSAVFSSRQYRGSAATPEVGYAFRIIKSDSERDAVISLGHDNGARVWLNGTRVYDVPTSTGFAFDRVQIPVHLHAGDNRLLLKFEHRTGPWRFAARVLEPGTVVASRDEIIPHVDGGSVLKISAESAHSHADRSVEISVTAAGGRVVGAATAPRDQTVEIPTASWSDGAYEVHLTTKTVWGKDVTVHVPWYKGSAVAAAQRLIADTSSPRVRMLADLVREKAGSDISQLPDDGWHSIHSPLLEYEELQLGQEIHAGGFVRISYVDDTDGSNQYCRAYLPPHYSSATRWPLEIFLHGFNPANPVYVKWWTVDGRHNDIADRHDVIYIEPHGRGNTQYMGIGERDVLRCLGEAKRLLSVDDDRVYLAGESMGGGGVWYIGSRHPELFAAIAPTYGGWDIRVTHDPNYNPNADLLTERFAQELQSTFGMAESLLNMPIYIHHGDQDRSVNVDGSRHAARMLQRWGYDVRYHEHPGRGHEGLDNGDEVADWFLAHRRVSAPLHVRVRSTDLDGAAAYWVRVTGLVTPIAVTRVDAQVIQPGEIRLDTENVISATLSLPRELAANPLRVVWNGEEHRVPVAADGTVSLARDTSAKRPGLAGGLSSFLSTPFALVVGTSSSDPLMNQRCKEKAEAFRAMWKWWQHEPPRVFTDQQLSAEDEKRYSLLLIGGPDANRVTRRMRSHLPLAVAAHSIAIDGAAFPASDAVVQMIYPSPAARDRYVLVVAGTSAAGMYFWNPSGLWNQPYGFTTTWLDWTIRDGRQPDLETGLGAERGRIASGAFDRHWRRDDNLVFRGDAQLRAHSPLREAPAADFRVAAATLSSYAGRYEIAPGLVVSIALQGNDRLMAETPDGMKSPLTAESNESFHLDYGDGILKFQRDASGTVTAVAYDGDRGKFQLKRLPG